LFFGPSCTVYIHAESSLFRRRLMHSATARPAAVIEVVGFR